MKYIQVCALFLMFVFCSSSGGQKKTDLPKENIKSETKDVYTSRGRQRLCGNGGIYYYYHCQSVKSNRQKTNHWFDLPGKLIFSENKLRTTEPNVILELISKPVAGSEEDKKERPENSPTFPLVCPEQEGYRTN